jgi:hypothetical protein
MQVNIRGIAMYDPNQMNSLYFYPHKLHFSPAPDASDSEQRNRWFPGYDVSTQSLRKKATAEKRPRDVEDPAQVSDRNGQDQDVDDARMDDDGSPRSNTGDG